MKCDALFNKHIIPKWNSVYNESIKSQLLHLSIDIFGFRIAYRRAVKIYQEFKSSNIQHHFLNVKISAITNDPYLKLSLLVLNIRMEGTVSQFFY